MVDPHEAVQLVQVLAILIVGACLVGLTPNPCDHPGCAQVHRDAAKRDKDAERQRYHTQWHDRPFPGCEWCDGRPR